MKKIFSLLTGLLLCLAPLHAQLNDFGWQIGLKLGGMNYFGDLSQSLISNQSDFLDFSPEAASWGAGLFIENRFTPTWGLRLDADLGYITANDRALDWQGNFLQTDRFSQALNFRTRVADANLSLVLHLDNGWLLPKHSRVSPYLFGGIGITDFEVSGDLFRGAGNLRYHYWPDGSIRSLPSNTETPDEAVVLTQDRNFETNLSALNTELPSGYETRIWQIPFGLGLRFKLADRVNLGLQSQIHYTFSDYLDDVSGSYRTSFDNSLQQYASNPGGVDVAQFPNRGKADGKNDWYAFTSVNLSFNLGMRLRKFKAPKLYTSPGMLGVISSPTEAQVSPMSEANVPPTKPIQETIPQASPETMVANQANTTTTPQATAAETQPTEAEMVQVATAGQEVEIARLKEEIAQLKQAKTEAEKKALEMEVLRLRQELEAAIAQSETQTKEEPKKPASQVQAEPKQTEQAEIDPKKEEELEKEIAKLQKDNYQQLVKVDKQGKELVDTQAEINALKEQNKQLAAQQQALQQQLQAKPQVDTVVKEVMVPADADTRTGVALGLAIRGDLGVDGKEKAAAPTALDSVSVDSVSVDSVSVDSVSVDSISTDIPTTTSLVDSAVAGSLQVQLQLDSAQKVAKEKVATPAEESPKPTPQREVVELIAPPSVTIESVNRIENINLLGLRYARVFFENGVTSLAPESIVILDEVIENMKQHPSVHVKLHGFADKSGNPVINQKLSEKRAMNVQEYLTKAGIGAERISSQYYGSAKAIGTNRIYDRRVDLELWLPEPKSDE